MRLYILKLFLTLISFSLADVYIKVTNLFDPEALCLDGQQSFVYLRQGQQAYSSGLIVYFMGANSSSYCGGSTLLSSLDNCLQTQAQISSVWKQNISITSGILADPLFESWAKVIIPYCDGALFQGYSKSPIKYKTKDLFLRGNKIVRSHLAYIDSIFNISSLREVVMAGSGVGAIGSLTWSRYFRDEIVMNRGNIQYRLILDSYPQSYPSLQTGSNQFEASLQNLVQIANVDEPHPFSLCSLRNEGQDYKCFLFNQSYMYLDFPIMTMESQYDMVTISKALEINCIDENGSLRSCSSAQRDYIQRSRSARIVQLIQYANFRDNSVWSIACAAQNFLGSNYQSSYFSVRGESISQAVGAFLAGRRETVIDGEPWPSNQKCAG